MVEAMHIVWVRVWVTAVRVGAENVAVDLTHLSTSRARTNAVVLIGRKIDK
jgi:hypothetical protein